VRLRKHQRIGVSWLWAVQRGLLADSVGTGKSFHAAALIAIMRMHGELGPGRVVVICRPAALGQWRDELYRVLPDLNVVMASGARRERLDRLAHPWDVLLIGFQMLQRDLHAVLQFDLAAVFVDDVDALRHPETKTAYSVKRLARDSPRVVILTGTPLQKQLDELHSLLEPIGGREVFGSARQFQSRYVRMQRVSFYLRDGRRVTTVKPVGYKNTDEFKEKIYPLALRRTAEDIDDVEMPALVPAVVQLDLHPRQAAAYAELKTGVLDLIRNGEAKTISHATAVAKIHYGMLVCAGMATLNEAETDGPGASAKLDWVMDTLAGDLSDEKVVVFIHHKRTIGLAAARLAAVGIGYVTFTGDDRRPAAREAVLRRFWEDPACRVFLGTSAAEQSLNLQVARHLIYVDTILNASRMMQFAGRIRRQGSLFSSVYTHQLVCRETQEVGYQQLLEREQALADHVWDEDSGLFAKLSPMRLLALITGR
jgi:SNF2 family DNA or RNA helicase